MVISLGLEQARSQDLFSLFSASPKTKEKRPGNKKEVRARRKGEGHFSSSVLEIDIFSRFQVVQLCQVSNMITSRCILLVFKFVLNFI